MKQILVTGFEPFDGYKTNPSQEVVVQINNQEIGKYQVNGIVLPLDYEKAFKILLESISKTEPPYILLCGQAYRPYIGLEKIAVNAVNTSRADNEGNLPESDLILENAPTAYFSTIDPKPLVAVLHEKEIPANISYHAGTYGCNWLFYKILHWNANSKQDLGIIFIHLPPLPKQALEKNESTIPTMSLDLELKAVTEIIKNLS